MRSAVVAILMVCAVGTADGAEKKRGKQLVVGPLSEAQCLRLLRELEKYDFWGIARVNEGAVASGRVTAAQVEQARAGCK